MIMVSQAAPFTSSPATVPNSSPRAALALANVQYEKKGSIAYVTVNRPKVLNALNTPTWTDLQTAFEDAKADASVHGVILTGAGDKAFIAGADISELAHVDAYDAEESSRFGQGVLNLVENLGKPVVAAINGFALGGGCELALSCTIRIASKTAKLGQPEVKLGILPGYGGSQRLARLCGKGVAHELCLTGEMITAEEAQRIGLVNHVYEPAELIPAAEAMAKKIIANAPLAVKYTMEAIERGVEMPQEEGLFLEAALFGLACATEDMREGTKAFLEKRPPQFKGK
jgi:enoyl-CoA hydratase